MAWLRGIIFIALGGLFFCAFLLYRNSGQPKYDNIVLITIDSLRADHLSCYGYHRLTTPNIDRLSAEGALFTQAISAGTRTPISMPAILTSTLLHKHKIFDWGYTLDPQAITLPQVLASNGYQTIFVSGASTFSEGMPFFRERFKVFFPKEIDFVLNAAGSEIVESENLTAIACNYIKLNKAGPFFIWIHYMDTHSPYYAGKFNLLYTLDNFNDKTKKLLIDENMFYGYGHNAIPERLAKMYNMYDNPDFYVAQYDGAIRRVDFSIGILLKELEQQGISKKTSIIITADHGELFGENGYYFHHGSFLYEPLIHVPLIIKSQRAISGSEIFDQPVNAHLDIAPTVLDILGIRKPFSMKGESLLPLFSGKRSFPRLVVIEDNKDTLCVRGKRLKYSLDGDKGEYFSFTNNEMRDIDQFLDRKEKKTALLMKTFHYYWRLLRVASFASCPLGEELKAKLKSLGYNN